jgi:hypothetical protein
VRGLFAASKESALQHEPPNENASRTHRYTAHNLSMSEGVRATRSMGGTRSNRRAGSGRLLRSRVLPAEAFNTTCNVHDLVFTRVERVACGANVGRETAARRSSDDDRATGAIDRRHHVVGMDVLLHDGFPGSERRAGASSMAPFAIARKMVSPSPLCLPRKSFGTIFPPRSRKPSTQR